MPLLLSFLFFLCFFLNDRLEQRDLGNYKTDLHQIFRSGRHVAVGVQPGIGFAIGHGRLPWQPILGAKSAEIVETRSILGTRIRQWMTGTTELICAKFTRKMCLVLRSDWLECQGRKSKVKVTRDKKRAVHSQHSCGVDGMERPRCG